MENLREDRLLVNSSMTSRSPSVPQFSPSLPHGQGERAVLPPTVVSAPPTSGPFFFWCSCDVLDFRIVPDYSFSPIDIVEQFAYLTGDGSFARNDQDSIRSVLQSFVDFME